MFPLNKLTLTKITHDIRVKCIARSEQIQEKDTKPKTKNKDTLPRKQDKSTSQNNKKLPEDFAEKEFAVFNWTMKR